MGDLSTLSADEIMSERLLLRKACNPDREGLIELQTDPEVRAYLGGPRCRTEVESFLDSVGAAGATAAPGSYVIADRGTDRLLGILMLDRRDAARPGHLARDNEELELSYVLRRSAWGAGVAFEAAQSALRCAAGNLPDQPVLVVTQSANSRALRLAVRLGFQRISVFEEFDAEQTLCTAHLRQFASQPRPEVLAPTPDP